LKVNVVIVPVMIDADGNFIRLQYCAMCVSYDKRTGRYYWITLALVLSCYQACMIIWGGDTVAPHFRVAVACFAVASVVYMLVVGWLDDRHFKRLEAKLKKRER